MQTVALGHTASGSIAGAPPLAVAAASRPVMGAAPSATASMSRAKPIQIKFMMTTMTCRCDRQTEAQERVVRQSFGCGDYEGVNHVTLRAQCSSTVRRDLMNRDTRQCCESAHSPSQRPVLQQTCRAASERQPMHRRQPSGHRMPTLVSDWC